MSTQEQMKKLDPRSNCRGHLSDAELQYLEDMMEYIPFIVVARTWGEGVNNIIRRRWSKVKVSYENLSPTDTLGRYYPCPPMVLNVGENQGVDTDEEIAGILQNMLLKEMFQLVQQLSDREEEKAKKVFETGEDPVEDEKKGEDSEDEAPICAKQELMRLLRGGCPQEASLRMEMPSMTYDGEDPVVFELVKPFASSVKLDD